MRKAVVSQYVIRHMYTQLSTRSHRQMSMPKRVRARTTSTSMARTHIGMSEHRGATAPTATHPEICLVSA